MSERVDEHVRSVAKRGTLSEGGVDIKTGMATGALAGAALGASAGPIGFVAGAVIGSAIGGIAASGPEQPNLPAPWPQRLAELHGEEGRPTAYTGLDEEE